MLVGISSDWHLGLRAGSRSDDEGVNLRTRDFERAVIAVIDGFIAQQVDIAVIPGDLYDSSYPDERARQFLGAQLNRLMAARGAGLRALIAGLGNHDAKMIFDDPTAIGTAALSLGRAVVVDRGEPVTTRIDDVAITVVPWMKSDEEFYRTIEGLRPEPGLQNLLFLHAGLAEIHEFSALNPGSQTLTRSQLPLDRYDWIFCGHFHKHRVFPDLRFTFIGSPERTSSAEIGTPKGYLTYDTDTRTTTFHPIPTRSWYTLGTLDATDWDATRILSELELARQGIPDWDQAMVWGKISHISKSAWDAFDVRAYKKLKASAFACEIETSFDDPALASEEGSGSSGAESADAPVLRDLPTEWAEHVAAVRTRKPVEIERIAALGLAALQHRNLLATLAEMHEREEAQAVATPEPEPGVPAGPPEPAELVPAPAQPHEMRKPRAKAAKKSSRPSGT
jgi:DNA repair exonuclease SbcCD nuclease subunit